MENYIAIKIAPSAVPQDDTALQRLFASYPKEDIYLEKTDNEHVVHLRALDFLSFKMNIQLLARNANNDTAQVLNSILYNIEKIKSYGLKGKKRLYVDYNRERKVKNRKEKEKTRGTYYYARDHTFSTRNNKIPEQFINKIMAGDSQEILKRFPENCVDLIFTSPPYNFGLEYENHKDGVNWNEYFDRLFAVFKECIRVLKYGGRIVVNVQPLFSDYIPIHHILSHFFIKNQLIWKGEILWDKHNYNCKYTAWGSWKSPSNPYLKYTWEFLEIFCKGDLKHPGAWAMADITGDEFKKWVYARWDIPPEYNMKKYGHPAMFSEPLTERVLKLFSFKNDLILDPFNGVGTTTVVAKRLFRNYIGIDISDDYCKKAEERLKRTPIPLNLF